MDVFSLARDYIERLIPADSTMKCLLLDAETVETVGVVFGQSQLLERGVFLVDQITQSDRTAVFSMRCIVFIRPTIQSIRALEAELQAGNFQSYTLGFSNAISSELLNRLAAADVHERVVRCEECFADFTAINRDLVLVPLTRAPPGSFELPAPSPLTVNSLGMTEAYFTRVVQGITAACLALRRRPLFRFAGHSMLAKRIATECIAQMRSDPELYNYQAKDTVMLICDRVDDVLTPLMTPWTYQAMLTEHLDMHNNRLLLPGGPVEENGFVFGQQDDHFFANNMYSMWGEVCLRVNEFVSKTKEKTSTEGKSMAELREMAQSMAANQQMKGTAQKHINCMTHMAEMIKKRCLYQVSTFEQRLQVESSASDHWTELTELAKKIQANIAADGPAAYANGATFHPGHHDILRLCLIYHLKYERGVTTRENSKAIDFVARLGVPEFDGIVQQLRAYIGNERDFKSCLGSIAPAGGVLGGALSSLIKGFSDVQSVKTQHDPLLKKLLVALSQNKLEEAAFPYAAGAPTNPAFRPKEVVVFMAGGCTMEEASMVAQLQNTAPGATSPTGDMRILLMAPNVLTSKTFVQALACARN